MSKRIQLNTIDLGGGTTKGCDCEAPNLSSYAKKDELPTKLSELENDCGFVESTSLGTAAYKDVEDLQVSSVPKLRDTISANYSDFGDAIYNGEVSKFLAKIESYGQSIEIYLQNSENGEYVNVTTLAGSTTEKTIFYLELEILMPGIGRLKVLNNNNYSVIATIPWYKSLMLIEIRNGNNVKISRYY